MAIKRLIVNQPGKTDHPGTHAVSKSVCAVLDRCGSCPRLDEPYTAQIAEKNLSFQKELAQCLAQYQHDLLVWNDPVESPSRFAYRHVVHLAVSWRLGDEQTPWVDLGFYKKDIRGVVDIGRCPVQPHHVNSVLANLRTILKEHTSIIFNPKTREGFLKNITIKSSHFTRQTMVIFGTLALDSEKEIKQLRPLARRLREELSHVEGVFIEKNLFCLSGNSSFREKYGAETFKIPVDQQISMNPEVHALHLKQIVKTLERTSQQGFSLGIWVYEAEANIWQTFLKPLQKPVSVQYDLPITKFDTLILPTPRYMPTDITQKNTCELLQKTAQRSELRQVVLSGTHPGRLAAWADLFLRAKFGVQQAWFCDTAPGTHYGECVLVLKALA